MKSKKKLIYSIVIIVLLAVFLGAAASLFRTKQLKKADKAAAQPVSVQKQGLAGNIAAGNKKKQPADMSVFLKDVKKKEEIHRIDIEEAKMLFDSGKALFVDARSDREYNNRHIKGAVSIPPGLAHERIPALEKELKNKILVTYCHGAGCHLSDKTAYKLYESGNKKVAIFFGGWPKWVEHKYPVEKGEVKP